MMRPDDTLTPVYVHLAPVDFRKQINGLALLVQTEMALDPFCEALFVFTNRRRDRVKCLYWERNGFVLWMKRLERDRFHWPRAEAGAAVVTLSGRELNWLLDGFDLRYWRPHPSRAYRAVA